MTELTNRPSYPASELSPEVPVERLLADLARLDGSAEPAETFSRLAELIAPTYCDHCTISIEQDGSRYRINWPAPASLDGLIEDGRAFGQQPDSWQPAGSGSVSIPIEGAGDDYRGELRLTFARLQPTASHQLAGRLLVERAVGLIYQYQQVAALEAALARIANLELALTSSREIGMAMGIVMDRHKLSSDQAFDLLSRISQHSRRKVREVAREMTETGIIDLPPSVGLTAKPTGPIG